jgi:hypothetical protein
MKTMIICLATFFLMHTVITAQTTATWVGGTPGKPSDWNSPNNWKEGRIPDENAQVIIPSDRQYYPVINCEVPDIDALLVAGGAKLKLALDASLSILGQTGRFDGLTVLGMIFNEGMLIAEINSSLMTGMSGKIIGQGTCLLAGYPINNNIAQK